MTAGKMPSPQRIALASVLAAALLVAIKLIVGLLSNSLGVLAEAIHSATDLAAALLTFFAVRVAVRPADRDHPYGHGKAEHLSALGESVILIAASLAIAGESVFRLAGHGGKVDVHWYAFAVLLVVIAIDSSRSIASRRGAHRHDSAALGANALHFTLDLIGSVAVLIGLLLVRAGYQDADSIAALLVAGLALFSAGRLMRRSVHALMDRISPEDDLRYASALLVLRLDADSTQTDAEALARHLRAEHPEVVDVTIRARRDRDPSAANQGRDTSERGSSRADRGSRVDQGPTAT
jgi:cation diffusion facilitator family transporter